ncbi:MAG TPA: hypothetical protein VMQ46_03575 [Acidimicrobiia bacterium]|nr:hypothetical protein [Acidimicrobiia bacterium]
MAASGLLQSGEEAPRRRDHAAIRAFHRSVAFESGVLVVVLRAMVVELGA